jgi:hypothetical protein
MKPCSHLLDQTALAPTLCPLEEEVSQPRAQHGMRSLFRLLHGGASAGALSLALLAIGCGPGGNGGSMDMTPPPDPQVRFAHFLVDIPAFDICVKGPGETEFTGPLIRTALQRNGGVPYGYATAYVTLKPVAYLAHVVSGLATGCNGPSLGGVPDMNFVQLVAGRSYTVAAMGNPLTTFKLPVVSLLEDDSTVTAGQARLRFVHAADGQGGLEFGSGSSGTYSKLFSANDYGKAGDAGGGAYATVPPVANGTYSLRASGAGGDLVTLMNKVSLTAGSVYTATVMGAAGSGTSPLSIALCNDTAMPMNGLAPCSELR